VLGPLEVVGDAGPLELGAPKHRALLALMLLEPGRVVSVDRLIEQLWTGEPPAGATSTLQAYVSNLRRVLEPGRRPGAPASVLVTRPPGYALDVTAEQVDALRFERAVQAAIAANDAQDVDEAARLLQGALALWRGQPFADVAFEPWAQAECERLNETHLVALETLLTVELARGRHASVVIEAERLSKEHPVRERFREIQMLALYRSGRQAEALRAYQEARDTLVEELGIEPGPSLRALEDRILAQDPSLDWHPPPGAVAAARVEPSSAAAPAEAPARATEAPARPAFVGRHRERVRLMARLDDARVAGSRLVLVAGEPGIGKTRLCEELSAAARGLGMHVVWARGWEGDGAPAFWPWVQVLRTLADELPTDTLVSLLDSAAGDIARVVPDYARFVAAPVGELPDAETARFRFFEAVTSLLRRASALRPMLVVLDDIHWADQSSLRLLEFAVNALHDARVLLLATYRDAEARAAPLAPTLATLARTPELERLTLSGLSEREVGDYVNAVLGEEADPSLAESLHGRTAGNPFFVAELVRLLRHEGRLGGGVDGAPVPEGVRDVIRTRLARLPQEAIPVLTAGAVAGREFDIALVAHVCGIDEDRALDLVEAAWMIGIVDESQAAFGHFKFSHELVREVLCDELSTLRRIRLHKRIGEAIEELHGERNPGFLTACAYHFSEAASIGDPLKAVLYGQKAADRLVAQFGYEDALPVYERAIALYEQYDVGTYHTRVDLLIGLGWALRASGRLSEARAALRRAIEIGEEHGDEVRIARAVLGIGGGSFWGWWDEFGVPDVDLVSYLERALAALDPDDSVLRCELLARLAIESYDLTDRDTRDRLTGEALAMARRLDDPVALTSALAARHLALWQIDTLTERLALADELVAVAASAGIGYAELIGRHFRMVDHLQAGDRAGLDADYDACERLVDRLGQHSFLVQIAWFRATRALYEGRLADAERLIQEAFDVNVRSNESAAWMALGVQLFHLRREQGRLEELEPLVRDAIETQPHVGIAWRIAYALILAEDGRTAEARDLVADVLVADLPALDNELLMPTYLFRLTEVCAAVGDEAGAAIVLPALDRFAGEVGVLATGHLCYGAIDRARGDLLRTMGRTDEACEAYRHAVDIDTAFGSPGLAARARFGLAAALHSRGDKAEAAELAAQVVATAEDLGFVALARQARDLL